ncbi:MAG: hypothetical protein JXB14_05760 [Candidatus Altiarchaeota archaeon]|nr:hypothetical protein [Candidatus Altiarchaeota archaeon]
MAEPNTGKISRWLDVTPQQFDILETIFRLQKQGAKATPKSIVEEDAKVREGPKIQKSNLFTQLKILRNRGFIRREEKASYALDIRGVKKKLGKASKRLDEEMREFRVAYAQTEEYFKDLTSDQNRITVEFCEYDQMYERTADILKNAEECFLTGVFPRILYPNSPCLMQTPGVRRYAETLWDLCIRRKTLRVSYLTRMDVEYLFKRLYETYNNPKLAYEEAKIILNNFEAIMDSESKLLVCFVDSPYGVDMIIPQDAGADEFFLMIRDKSDRGIGAVYIRSSDLAKRFKHIFAEECKKSIKMRGPEGKKVLDMLRGRLEKVYGSYAKAPKVAAQ